LNPQRKRPLWGCKSGKEGVRTGRRNGIFVLKKESVSWTCSSSSSSSRVAVVSGGGVRSGGSSSSSSKWWWW